MLILLIELLEDYKACRFEKWYYSEEGKKFRRFSIFFEFKEVHKGSSIL
ncbi:MAG: hypothetical protein DRP29_06585 [Thermodesulfobacteriota bacterium]|nr:MAG: hypothetical protein DRP29_06585 [Thermodesulfobacteriota bacterium]